MFFVNHQLACHALGSATMPEANSDEGASWWEVYWLICGMDDNIILHDEYQVLVEEDEI